MKIVILVDKLKSAIHRLAIPIQKHNPHLDIEIIPFHPKRPDIDQVANATKAISDCDVIHVSYWRSFEKLREYMNSKALEKPRVLWHHNPYDIKINYGRVKEYGFNPKQMFVEKGDNVKWNKIYNMVVVHNSSIHDDIPYAKKIKQGIDLEFLKFNEDYTSEQTVLMVSSRIESKKGVKEVAQACKDLGYKFLLVGRVSDGNYMKEVRRVNPDLEFREDVSEKELRNAYYESAILVCNSNDNHESGPLPILEAMATGVPVLTRNIGQVPDLFSDKTNMIVRQGKRENTDDLKKELKALMANKALRKKIRENAWNTIKNYGDDRLAWEWEKIYYDVWRQENPLVSIITPTRHRPEVAIKSVLASIKQDYPYKEIILVDSGKIDLTNVISKIRSETNVPVKYIRFNTEQKHSLAQARNRGIIEARGELLCFADERVAMKPNAVSVFVENMGANSWLFGIKDNYEKRGFVENFSMVTRDKLISYGMFNERIEYYGGMSQELRTRYKDVVQFQLIYNAKADMITRTTSKTRRRDDIRKAKTILYKLYGET